MTPKNAAPSGFDLAWNDWHSLNPTEGELSTIPTTAGLYRIRHHYYPGLEYIGQTGRSLRGRIGALARNTYNEEMPYRDPYTAAPSLWAIRQEDGPAFGSNQCQRTRSERPHSRPVGRADQRDRQLQAKVLRGEFTI